MSTWYDRAAVVIRAAIAAGHAAGETDAQIKQRVDAAYPFGKRERWPYRAWLKARRELLATDTAYQGWQQDRPIVDPGAPLTPLESYLETTPDRSTL